MDENKGLVPDTSVLVYYLYGNSSQRKSIADLFEKFNQNIILNQILLSEIGRVVFQPFYILKNLILNRIQNEKITSFDDFWINLTQDILKNRKKQLIHRSIVIITHIRNLIQDFSIDKSDSKFFEKMVDRINISLNIFDEELFKFQNEIKTWRTKDGYECPQSEWELEYHKSFKFRRNTKCSIICDDRRVKLKKLTHQYLEIFLKIKEEGKQYCKEKKLSLDERLYNSVIKLIESYEKNEDLDFRTYYCYNLGDFLISSLLIGSSDMLCTYNTKDFLFLSHFLFFEEKRIIKFNPQTG